MSAVPAWPIRVCLLHWQAVLLDVKFWSTATILISLLTPIVSTLRTFESDGWVPAADGQPGREVLLSSVPTALYKMRELCVGAAPEEWKQRVHSACSATFQKAITDAHVCRGVDCNLSACKAWAFNVCCYCCCYCYCCCCQILAWFMDPGVEMTQQQYVSIERRLKKYIEYLIHNSPVDRRSGMQYAIPDC